MAHAAGLEGFLAVTGLPREEIAAALGVVKGTPALGVLERLPWLPILDLPREFTGATVGMAIITVGSCLIGWLVDENRRKEDVILSYAYTDGLTGVANYRRLRERLDEEIKRARRYGHPFAILVVDTDNLRDYNNAHGHLAGDAALKGVAGVLAANVRDVDLVARYGGDEFVVIMVEASRETAMALAERLKELVAGYTPPENGEKGPITISIGVALFPWDAISVDDLLSAADKALYQAKAAGGNQIRLAQPPPGLQS